MRNVGSNCSSPTCTIFQLKLNIILREPIITSGQVAVVFVTVRLSYWACSPTPHPKNTTVVQTERYKTHAILNVHHNNYGTLPPLLVPIAPELARFYLSQQQNEQCISLPAPRASLDVPTLASKSNWLLTHSCKRLLPLVCPSPLELALRCAERRTVAH